MQSTAWVYIVTNKHHTTFYTGMTNDIKTRVWEYQTKMNPSSFVNRYNLSKVIYCEGFATIVEAIDREKFIKGKKRKWKENLITSVNPKWRDFSERIMRL